MSDSLLENQSDNSLRPDRHGLPDRTSYEPGLKLLLRDIDRSRTLRPEARPGIDAFLDSIVNARNGMEDWFAAHPEIALAPVTRPLFIMGMPRAGTTMLFNLLRLDPQRRVLWNWEANNELPPAHADHMHDDPRIAIRVREIDALLENGDLPRNHHVELGDEPTECIWPMTQDFKSLLLLVQTQVPDYFEWFMHDADLSSTYAYHRRYLQVLQSAAPGSWTLKLPSHALAIDEILATYPDARIVYTHRDPIKPVASTCSLNEQTLSLTNTSVDRKMLGYQMSTWIATCAERMSVARDAHPETPFLDIHYKTFTQDPMKTIRALYLFEGLTLTPEVEARMQAEILKHNQGRESAGVHRYRLEDFGLTESGMDKLFGNYVERYGIALERS